MFSLKEFVKIGLIQAIGKMPSYQIRLRAAEWFDKGVLDEYDLSQINTAIEAQENTFIEE